MPSSNYYQDRNGALAELLCRELIAPGGAPGHTTTWTWTPSRASRMETTITTTIVAIITTITILITIIKITTIIIITGNKQKTTFLCRMPYSSKYAVSLNVLTFVIYELENSKEIANIKKIIWLHFFRILPVFCVICRSI